MCPGRAVAGSDSISCGGIASRYARTMARIWSSCRAPSIFARQSNSVSGIYASMLRPRRTHVCKKAPTFIGLLESRFSPEPEVHRPHHLARAVLGAAVILAAIPSLAEVQTVPGMPPVPDAANLYSEQTAGKMSEAVQGAMELVYV